MFAFPRMLVQAAINAGIPVPPIDRVEDIIDDENLQKEYQKFNLFCLAQLGESMPYAGVHYDNAKVIARIPDDKIKTITMNELIDMGFAIGNSYLRD